jgi:hypothetical protein
MDVYIDEVSSTVKALDSQALLDEDIMRRIIRAVLQALREQEMHDQRALSERRVTRGVAYELEAEEN